ncbi:SWIB/MDM2 domain-containing protein [Nanoarchaeota archaeon]
MVKKKAAKKKPAKKGGKRLPFGGMVIKPDADLAKIIGKKAVPPSAMTKAIWVYIKKKKLLKK